MLTVNFYTISIRVNAEWMCARKDYEDAKRQTKEYEHTPKKRGSKLSIFSQDKREPSSASSQHEPSGSNNATHEPGNEGEYLTEMDSLKCILFFHGGRLSRKSMVLICLSSA